MACLDSFIGLRGICDPADAPESGLYVNDLPMGGLDRLEALSDRDTQDFVGVWNRVYARAIALFKGDVRKNLPIRLRANSILENVVSGEIKSPIDLVGNSAQWQGVFIKLFGSSNATLNIPFLRIWLQAGANVPVKIWDAVTGTELYSNTFIGVTGENLFYPKIESGLFDSTRRYVIAFDNTGLDVAQTNVKSLEWCACHGVSDHASMKGASISTAAASFVESAWTKQSDSGGLVVAFSLRCDLDKYICQNRMALANAIWLKSGIETYLETLEGDSVFNRYTLISSDEIRKRIEYYQNEYITELVKVLESIPVTDSVCFDCAGPVKTQYQTG